MLPLAHVPPPTVLNNAAIPPTQAVVVPVMGAFGFTVTVAYAGHPAVLVYVMLDVPPAIPVTIPVDAPTVAIVVLPLVHVPPGVALLRLVVLPWQTVFTPVIAGGDARTENVIVLVHPRAVV